MANSVHQDRQGPVWPLGNIPVPTPGTPVRITNIVDPTNVNAPETPAGPGPSTSDEYTPRCQKIVFQAFKAGAAPPKFAANTGNVYIVKKNLAGAGGQSDVGTVLYCLVPGASWELTAAALNRDVFSPYEFYIDADTANDGCQVTLVTQ